MPLQMESVFGQTDDNLKDRWQQSTSNVVNEADTNLEDETLYSVTSGKTLYVTNINFHSDVANYQSCILQDGVAGDNKIILHSASNDEGYNYVFSVPLEFTTGVYVNASGTWDISIIGWEE